MRKNGSISVLDKNHAGSALQQYLTYVFTNGVVTNITNQYTHATEQMPTTAVKILTGGICDYYIQTSGTTTQGGIKVLGGTSTDENDDIINPRACYINFDGPSIVFDDIDNPGGSSSASFDIVVPS